MENFSARDTKICKGIAILMMLFHHMFLSPDRYKNFTVDFSPFSESSINSFANYLKICVGIYAFLSAFGLTCSYQKWKKSDSRFFIYRYFKMMLEFFAIYIIAVIVSLFVNSDWNLRSVYGGDGKLAAVWKMLIDFLGLAELFHTPTFNSTWWYMSLAIVILLLIPVDRFGGTFLMSASLFLPAIFGIKVVPVTRWLLCIAIGIVCARTNALGKLKEKYNTLPAYMKILSFVFSCSMLFVFYRLRQGALKNDFIEIWDSIIPVMVIVFAFLFVNNIPVLSDIFNFFGEYSMIIFLTHTFIRYYWFTSLAYISENIWLDYIILISVSLAVAIVIKSFLRVCRYNKFEKSVLDKIS